MSLRFMRIREVEDRVGYKKTTIYEKVRKGEFPAPVALGSRARAWVEQDILDWIAGRIAKSRADDKGSV